MRVNEDDEDLDEKRRDIFCSIVAKLLFIIKRARIDLKTTVTFLCTRVTKNKIGD